MLKSLSHFRRRFKRKLDKDLHRTLSFSYDSIGRLVSEKQELHELQAKDKGFSHTPFSHTITHSYDALGNRSASQLPSLGAAADLQWHTYGSGHVHGVSLGGQDLIHFERDQLHRETQRRFGALSNSSGATSPSSSPSSSLALTRQYDSVGRLLSQRISGVPQAQKGTQAQSAPHIDTLAYLGAAYGYDGSGQLASLLKVASLTPNATTTSITPNDKTLTQYSYDSAQRLVAWERGGKDKPTELDNWRFDPAGNRLPANSVAKHPDKTDKKAQESDWSARVQQNLANPNFNLLEPDQNPNLRPEQRTQDHIQRWQTNRVDFIDGMTYTHDAYGNLIKSENLQNPKNPETTLYGYDGEHRLVWLQKTTQNTTQHTAKIAINSGAAKASNTLAIANNNTTIQTATTTTTATYTYDALGRRLQKVVSLNNETPPTTTHYGYDGDRLVCTQSDASKVHTIYEPGSFVPLLRISESFDDNAPKTEAEATEANARQLLGFAEKHGKPEKPVNPNDKPKEPHQLPGFGTAQWAGLSKSFAHLAEHGYPESMKALLRQAGLDPDKIVAQAQHAVSEQKAAQSAKLKVQMYHCNHLGTPIALINQDGWIDWAVELDPWGNVLNEFNPNNIDQPIRMQGQQIDRESGLFYNRHRYYDPNVGRYITQDPIGLNGGWNSYAYVEGNPANTIDPLGLDATVWRFPNGPTNGNWGGRCWSGGQRSCGDAGMGNLPPLDSADAIYKKHDICLSKTKNKTPYVSPEETACHRSMTEELRALPDNPKQWPQPPRAGTEADSRSFKKHAEGYFFPQKK